MTEPPVVAALRRFAEVAPDECEISMSRADVWELLGWIEARRERPMNYIALVVVSLALWAGIIAGVAWCVS